MKRSGFTLIELMIVVAIIAIIAAIAIPSLLRSRMAAHETSAIACCRTYCEAQYIYRRTDYDGDGILEYAQTLRGGNSLLETTSGAADLALIDKAFGNAEGAPGTATSRAGYVFSVVTSQGAAASGGVMNYITPNPAGGGSSMTIGYALSAVPDAYDATGRSTYIINHVGTAYQLDQGTGTAHITVFNPNSTWAVAE